MTQNAYQYYRPQGKQKKSYEQFHHKQQPMGCPSKLSSLEHLWQHNDPREVHAKLEPSHIDSSVSPPNLMMPLDPKHQQRKNKKRISVVEWPKEVRM